MGNIASEDIESKMNSFSDKISKLNKELEKEQKKIKILKK